ncbi:hypothetical protein, partial [Klebsiella pneumoniae]|uniref:hypothetical protein n=1 Tax=Klebsiella pneumoniae TaxID=573 RepID=UPI0019552101
SRRREITGIFKSCRVSSSSDLSVHFCDARQGRRSLWKNGNAASFSPALSDLSAFALSRYP